MTRVPAERVRELEEYARANDMVVMSGPFWRKYQEDHNRMLREISNRTEFYEKYLWRGFWLGVAAAVGVILTVYFIFGQELSSLYAHFLHSKGLA